MKKFISTITLLLLLVLGLKNLDKPNTNQNVEIVESTTVTNTEPINESETTVSKNYGRNTFVVRGLGNVSSTTLKKAATIIENFYGFNTEIQGNIEVTDNLLYNNTDTLDGDVCLKNIRENVKTIYITSHPLKGSNLDLRGYTYLYGNVVIVKSGNHLEETLIHEIGHTFGLDHCQDLTCVMAINNDEYDSGNFCSNCKSKFNN